MPLPTPGLRPAWLSNDVACALAAISPPSSAQDAVQAANELTSHAPPTDVIRHLLEHGADLMNVRMVVEALRA